MLDTRFNLASFCETSSPSRYEANMCIEACSPPVSEERGHVRSPNCIKVRRNQGQGARHNSLSNNTDTCNDFWSMEEVLAELQDLESTLDCLHDVKQGSADMLKCRVARALSSMKEALQEQQSYGLQLKSMLDGARFSTERRAGRYAEELKMIKQQHFLSTYPFQLEDRLETILHKARQYAMSARAQYAMSAWHAATAESRNKLDARKLNQIVSMKRSCVNVWSRAAFHSARRTHASKQIQSLSTFSKLAHSFGASSALYTCRTAGSKWWQRALSFFSTCALSGQHI